MLGVTRDCPTCKTPRGIVPSDQPDLDAAVADWKVWHRRLSDALGCEFYERTITLEKAIELRNKVRDLETELDRLRQPAPADDAIRNFVASAPIVQREQEQAAEMERIKAAAQQLAAQIADPLDARARELIAARAKASPGPWFINERTGDICHGDPADDRDNYPIDLPTDDDFFMCAGNHAAAIAQGYLDLGAALRAIAKACPRCSGLGIYDDAHDEEMTCHDPMCVLARSALKESRP